MPTVLAQLHDDRTQASCPAAPGGIPLAMTGFAWLLYRVNDRTSAAAVRMPWATSCLIAIWFFFYSEMWLVNPL